MTPHEPAIIVHSIDKTGWPRGAWDQEPDEMKFYDPGTKLPCVIRRLQSGALAGYVGIDSSIPAYGKHHTHLRISVHGGLIFSAMDGSTDAVSHFDASHRWWWLGFDCDRYGDWAPTQPYYSFLTYRPWPYVHEEVGKLAKALKDWHP